MNRKSFLIILFKKERKHLWKNWPNLLGSALFHLKKIYQTFLGICSLLQGRRKLSEHTRGKTTWWAQSAPHNWNNPWGHPDDSLGSSWGFSSELSLTGHMLCPMILTNPNFPFKFYKIMQWFTNLNQEIVIKEKPMLVVQL